MGYKIKRLAFLTVVVFSLSACIGGSNSDDDDEAQFTTPPPPPQTSAEIQVSPVNGLSTSEDGGMATFSVVLATSPNQDVSITLRSSDSSEGIVSPTSLSFTSANWSQAQTVTVTGIDDGAVDGNIVYTIITDTANSVDTNYNGLDAADVNITNNDNDIPVAAEIRVDPIAGLSTSEAGQTASFSVVLSSAPTANTTIGLRSSDTTEGIVEPESLSFNANNWDTPQTVTITGQDDVMVDGPINYMIITDAAVSADANYNAVNASDVALINTDNDVLPIISQFTASPSAIDYDGSTTLSWESNAEKCTASGAMADGQWQGDLAASGSKVLSNLKDAGENNFMLTCSIAGLNSAVSNVTVTVAAQANAPTVTLNADPVANIAYNSSTVLTWSSTNADTCVASGGWTGNKGTENTAGEIITNLTADTSFTLSCTGAGGSGAATVAVTVVAVNPTLNFGATPSTIDLGQSTTLSWQSTDITSCIAIADPENPMWTGDKAVSNAGGEVISNLQASTNFTLSCTGIDGSVVSESSQVTVNLGTPAINVSPVDGLTTSENGDMATFSVVLVTPPSDEVSLTLNSSETSEGMVSPSSLTFDSTNWSQAQTVTVTGIDDGAVDGNVDYTIVTAAATSVDANYNGLDAADVSVTNTDNDVAIPGAINVNPTSGLTTSEAGQDASFTVVLGSQPTAEATIGLRSSDTTEGTVNPQSLTFTTNNWNTPQTITVSGQNDAIVDGPISYMVITDPAVSADPEYNDLNASDVSLMNTDNDVLPVISQFSANNSSVVYSGNTTLSWTSTGDKCTASGATAGGQWSGDLEASGSKTLSNLIDSGANNFMLTCSIGALNSAVSSAGVTVAAQPNAPSVTLNATPIANIPYNSATVLTWSTTDADSCVASGGWSGNRARNNSNGVNISNLTTDTSFTLTCTGLGGSGSSTVAVTVTPANPTLTFNASPTLVDQGQATTLTWQSTDISSCNASANPSNAAWSGSKAASNAGGVSVNNLQAATTFTLTCTGINNAQVSESVQVNVNIDTTPNPDRGKNLYENPLAGQSFSCATCHGVDGVAFAAPRDITQEPCFQNRCSDEDTLATYITNFMPIPPGACDTQCGKDIAAYLFRDIIGAEINKPPVSSSAFYNGVSAMDDGAVMHKAAMILSGRKASNTELNTAGDRAAMKLALMNMMQGSNFNNFIKETVDNRLLTSGFNTRFQLSPSDFTRRTAIENDNNRRDSLDHGINFENIELVKYIVNNNRPYSEILTANYTMVNPETADLYQATLIDQFPNGANQNTFVRARSGINFQNRMGGAYPHAGLLTQSSFINKWQTTDTNRNRMRARVASEFFLGVDLEALATRAIDIGSTAGQHNPVVDNPNCNVCHNTVDPIAGTFQNWMSNVRYRPRNVGGTFATIDFVYRNNSLDINGNRYWQAGDLWYRDMKTPGYPFSGANLPAGRNDNALLWLGQQMVADTRFDTGTAKFWYRGIFGRKELATPSEPNAALQAAFDAQTAMFNEVGQSFRSSGHNLKDLLAELILSPWFRAQGVDAANSNRTELAQVGMATVLTPEQLDRKLNDVFGRGLDNFLTTDYYQLYGNFNAERETLSNQRNEQLSSVMSNTIQRLLSNNVCDIVAEDFNKNAGQRLLFPNVQTNSTPGNAEAAIRQNLVYLHRHMWRLDVGVNDPEIDRSYQLLTELRSASQADNVFPPCAAVGNTDANHMKRTWMMMILYLVGSYEFLYE
jgi:mono/diheme cytochrome c family protein